MATHTAALSQEERPPRRWHAHGWNRVLSWELMLRIMPRVPRAMFAPMRHATSAICFLCMRRERAAARRNIERVTGAVGLRSLRLAYRLFYNFSRFMVAYVDMPAVDPGSPGFRRRVIGAEDAERAIEDALREGRGAILGTIHLGHWDVGLRSLSHFRVPVHVVMFEHAPVRVARYAGEARQFPGLRVHQAGENPLLGLTLMQALQRREIVAIQMDRTVAPSGQGTMRVPFFGADAELPTGPVQLAIGSGAPLLPIFVVFEGADDFRLVTLPPLRFETGEPVATAMTRLVAAFEPVIARYADQWFNFYDVWAEPPKDAPREPPRA